MREVLEIIERMHRELRLRIPGSKLMLVCLFGRLVTLLCRAYESSSGNEAGDLGNIDRAVSYIHRNYAKRISRGELARLTGMSESSFYRLFLRLIGCTPMEYLVRTRFLYAGKMLLETSRDLSSIARSCGFSDSNYFGTRVRERYGETPHQYRTRMRRKAAT
ncbi:Bifunctional transcriptional activator/DNA repair enzyme AdaA [bioreactor metagenome]|uniref:Bifunctional transcriptional activator/DNA repair enzyme AdaA n=1 Tax=bioreactor metagenome TaxID=1076179 RepID=A0A645I6V8_9ZZZZ